MAEPATWRPLELGGGPERVAARLLATEWLVTNGLGGYASGTIAGVTTRRYHGLLVAALANPHGRTMMWSALGQRMRLPGGARVLLGAAVPGEPPDPGLELLGFGLELGLPVWRWRAGDAVLERRIVMPHERNTVIVEFRLVEGPPVHLDLRPAVHMRPHDAPVSTAHGARYTLSVTDDRYELRGPDALPPLRLRLHGRRARFLVEQRWTPEIVYPVEASRGYDARGQLFGPGQFRAELAVGAPVALVGSTERWERLDVCSPDEAIEDELARRRALIAAAPAAAREGVAAELVLAADPFLIRPAGRAAEVEGEDAATAARSVIAGYHWFTDWGRDTMISLEGLALCTGRHGEAAAILRTFGRAVRDGLVPNLFPEGTAEGLYHTADATLWFVHAIDRHVALTGDRALLAELLPVLRGIVRHHLAGTRFGIGVDPADGLLRQGAPGYQLTWMDAKVGDWVVTPRRGKAVEINALWYNALVVVARWLGEAGDEVEGAAVAEHAARARASFGRRFWNPATGCLFDVVDGEGGVDDPAVRPNQLLAIALPNPVLDPARWAAVVERCARDLLTPVGLRSLAPAHPDYKPNYHGDLLTRDAAYHQGTVWSWLIGPFVDAWRRAFPDRAGEVSGFLAGLLDHLGEGAIGSVSEVFDAEAPYHPRGCVAQAWGVAELLRALLPPLPAPA